MKTKLALLMFAGVIVAGGYWSWGQGQKLESLQREMTNLREEQQTRSKWPLLPVFKPMGSGAPTEGTAESAVAHRPVALDRKAATSPSDAGVPGKEVRSAQSKVEEAFMYEPSDGAWATKSRDELTGRISSVLVAGSSLRQVDCHSSICRIELLHPNAETMESFVRKNLATAASAERVWNGPGIMGPTVANPDGTLTAVIYLGRDAKSLVMPD